MTIFAGMKRRTTLNAPLLPLAASLIAGIVAGHEVGAVNEWYSLLALVAAVTVTALLTCWSRWQAVGIWLCTALFGFHLSSQDMSLPEPAILTHARQNMLQVRSQLTQQYHDAGLEGEAYAIISAMSLGDKSAMTPYIRRAYNETGAAHVLALSGLHLGIIYWLVTFLTLGDRWRLVSQVVTILVIWAFAFLTGLSPSIVRSAIMLTVYALMNLGYRRHASVNVLAFTTILMLVATPTAVFDIGFQMSFLAVLSILLFYPLLYRLLPDPFLQNHTLIRVLWGTITVSVAAQIGVAPLIAFYFHRFSTYFLLANFVVIPEAYLILIGSLVLLVSGSTVVASGLTTVASLSGSLLSSIARLPGASVEPLHPTVLQVLLLYVVMVSLYIAASRLSRT